MGRRTGPGEGANGELDEQEEENEAEKWMEEENKKSFLFHRAMKPA